MAGVIKSKGNQIFTAGVRQVSTDTGSNIVGQAMQRASNRIADQMYRDAVVEQREFGRQAALTAPIRGEDNKLQFVDITEDMSRVARNAARPILERDYARAFKVDVETALINARSESKTSEEFMAKSQQIISGFRDAVPDEFQFLTDRVINDSATDVQNQHYNAMLLQESREQERIRLENLQIQYADQVDTVRALVQNNQYGSANAMREAILADMRETGTEDGLTDQFIKSITDQVDQAYYGEIAYREVDRLLKLGDEDGVIALRRAFLTGNANDSIPTMSVPSSSLGDDGQLTIEMSPRLIDQDQLDSIGNIATRRVIANQISVLHGVWAKGLADKAEAAAVANLMENVAGGNSNATGAKAEARLDAGFAAAGIRTDVTGWANSETVATIEGNSQLLNVMVNGNILPASFKATLDGVASGDLQIQGDGLANLLKLYNLSTKGIGEAGPVHRPKGMSDETFMFFEALHSYANTFGTDRVADGVNFLNMGSGRLPELESKIQMSFGQPNQSAERIISTFMIENQDKFDGTFFSQPLTPGSVRKLMPVAIRAFGSLPKDQAVEVVANAYQAIYGETNLIRSPDGFEYTRHEFAPETFYGSRGTTYNVFLTKANDILAANTGNVTDIIGETHFLWPSNQSTNRKIVWTVVDAEGNYVRRNGSSMPLTISTDQINRSEDMQSAFKRGLEAKIARARNVRSAVIEQAETSITGTGDQAESYLERRGITN
tara:strand:+ start:8457 stop:10628 length:2172 start_codon:yes stop_codon:yes gene_type:complete